MKITLLAGVLLAASYLTAIDRTPMQKPEPGSPNQLRRLTGGLHDLQFRRITETKQGPGNPQAAGYAMMTKLDSEGWTFPGWREGVLPEIEWPQEVKDLQPLKVYRSGPDVVFMMSREGQIERGYYYLMPPSSVSPRSGNGWEFLSTGSALWSYARTHDKKRQNKSE